jgi:hypothetical protein
VRFVLSITTLNPSLPSLRLRDSQVLLIVSCLQALHPCPKLLMSHIFDSLSAQIEVCRRRLHRRGARNYQAPVLHLLNIISQSQMYSSSPNAASRTRASAKAKPPGVQPPKPRMALSQTRARRVQRNSTNANGFPIDVREKLQPSQLPARVFSLLFAEQ